MCLLVLPCRFGAFLRTRLECGDPLPSERFHLGGGGGRGDLRFRSVGIEGGMPVSLLGWSLRDVRL